MRRTELAANLRPIGLKIGKILLMMPHDSMDDAIVQLDSRRPVGAGRFTAKPSCVLFRLQAVERMLRERRDP
jgi:hypothetical protein